MTKFEDGPAKGQTLMLQRAPIFLRVVETDGKWDALDQVNDTPKHNEKIFAYLITERPGRCHLYFGGGRGGWYMIARYRVVAEQPTEAVMKSTTDWRAWCESARDAALSRETSPGRVQASARLGESTI